MATEKAALLGQLPIGKLLIQQSVPASIGILAMSINILVDTIFVGQWIGADAIAAINVVLPVSFFIDPSIKDDKFINDLSEITLSYTMFIRDKEEYE